MSTSRGPGEAPSGGQVAIVLHAHLPWVRHPEHARSLEEAWLYEALWESYLPLLGVLDDLAARAPERGPLCTVSISPTLASMLRDPHHRARFEGHLGSLERLIERARAAPELAALRPGIEDHATRLERSRARWVQARRDVLGAFGELEKAGGIELGTTAATHAFLPGLRVPASVRAQLRVGRRYHHALFGRETDMLWLPECGFDERLAADVADSGARYTVLESHGLTLARPRPPHAPFEPVLGPGGVAYFGRDPDLVARVWSKTRGFPGDPVYREFHRDLGTDGPPSIARDLLGPNGERLPVGVRPWAVTGSEAKAPYLPERARARVAEHADELVARCVARLSSTSAESPLAVLAFDAELFGHWWWEGPAFLEALLERLDGRDGRPRATSLGGYLSRDPAMPVAYPATSTWGEGGFADVWAHPSTAHLFRMGHRAARRVLHVDAVVRDLPRSAAQREARLLAIREAMLLESSDFAFMLRTGEFVPYATARVREHAANVERLTLIAERAVEEPADGAFLEALRRRGSPFPELDEDAFSDVFDPW